MEPIAATVPVGGASADAPHNNPRGRSPSAGAQPRPQPPAPPAAQSPRQDSAAQPVLSAEAAAMLQVGSLPLLQALQVPEMADVLARVLRLSAGSASPTAGATGAEPGPTQPGAMPAPNAAPGDVLDAKLAMQMPNNLSLERSASSEGGGVLPLATEASAVIGAAVRQASPPVQQVNAPVLQASAMFVMNSSPPSSVHIHIRTDEDAQPSRGNLHEPPRRCLSVALDIQTPHAGVVKVRLAYCPEALEGSIAFSSSQWAELASQQLAELQAALRLATGVAQPELRVRVDDGEGY